MIDSFAAEIHPEAYSTRELAETILAWGTHQLGFNDERDYSAPILRIISNRLLLMEFYSRGMGQPIKNLCFVATPAS